MNKLLDFLRSAVFALAVTAPLLGLAAGQAQAQSGPTLVKLTTSKGVIVLELDSAKAPVTAANFVKNVQDGFYNGLIFHRVINGFMIQAGGMDASMREKTGRPSITNEAGNGLKNEAYTVAMARTNDPQSASTQFFINVANNAMLNHTAKTPDGWGYAVFGKVVEGREVVDAIKAVPTTSKDGYRDVPVEPVTILKAEVLKR